MGNNDEPGPPSHLHVLGGGPAGLGVGFFAKQRGIPFTIHEAAGRPGGNAVTFERRVDGHGTFRFDSGAHRFHDKDPEVTALVRSLLGESLRRVEAPSRIVSRGVEIDFPLSPLDLLRKLDLLELLRASLDLLVARAAAPAHAPRSLEEHAVRSYGRTIAKRFLLDYSEKLWGLPCDELSTAVSGRRLQGLDLRTFALEALAGARVKTTHLDGAFFYPEGGYGRIIDALVEACGEQHLRLGNRVARLLHDGSRIQRLELENGDAFDVDEVVSTLPLGALLRMLDPAPPPAVLEPAKSLVHRSLVLVALFLDRPSVTDAATLYFPDPQVPFTRASEPRNRFSGMSPPRKTSLLVEVPCQPSDAIWSRPDAEITADMAAILIELGWIRPAEVISSEVKRLANAYPVLRSGFESDVQSALRFLERLHNLRVCGRNGRFAYTHVHDHLRDAQEVVQTYPS